MYECSVTDGMNSTWMIEENIVFAHVVCHLLDEKKNDVKQDENDQNNKNDENDQNDENYEND